MTVQRRAQVLGWREWLAAELTIFRSTLRGLRRSRVTSAAARRMRAIVWAVSPHDGHRHAFDVQHLPGTPDGYAQARCSHPASIAGLRSAIQQTGPSCIACAVLVGEILADAGSRPRSFGTH